MLPLDVTFAAAAATGLGSATTSEICIPGDPALCCDSLKLAGLGDRLLYPNTTNYNEREESFFSINGRLQPHCIYQPRDAAEVSLGFATLLEVPTCQIAIRSGGHHHAAGCNNINDGVTIDLFNLHSVEYDATTKTTKVGPGAQWGDVYRHLDPMGLAVAGGRDATVGVGGLIIGGGNSFYSGRHGMVCDGVVRFEVVLATGEIILADRDNNSDLWLALKGGHSNFGIVTSFELDTFDTGLLWGGTVYYSADKREPLVSAFTEFADKVDDHPPSSSILFWSWQPSIKATVIGTSLVNVDNDVYDEPHKAFYQIANLTSSMRSTTITDLTEELEFPGEIYDCIQFTFSFKNDARVLNKIVDLHDIAVAKFKDEGSDFVSVAMFQPLAPSYAREGLKRGGNVLGLDLFGETRIMTIIWLQVKPEYVGAAKKLVQTWYDEFRAFAESVDRDSDWVYLNYAYASQDPISGYGKTNVDKIRAAAAKYDPTGVFQTRVPGGFKISKVPI